MPICFISAKCRYKVSDNIIVQRWSFKTDFQKMFNKIVLNEFELIKTKDFFSFPH